MNEQDFVVKREKNESDDEFIKKADLKFMNDDSIKEFYDDIKKQLKVIFWINVIFCTLSALVILVGICYLIIKDDSQTGIILSVAGVISEFLGNIFINQYKSALNKVSEEYYRLLLCSNMNDALKYAKELPLVDMRNTELRYLEIREILRAIMKNFDQHISLK